MASILIDNGNLTTPQQAPGARLQYLQDGTITGSCKFTSRLGSAGSGTAIGAAHPYNSNAFCSESQVTYNESEAEIDSNYIGVWSSSVQKVSTVAGVAAQTIQACKNWLDTAGTAPDGALRKYAVLDPATAAFSSFPTYQTASAGPPIIDQMYCTGPPTTLAAYAGPDEYRLAGVTGFLQGATTIRISYSATSGGTVTSALAKMGSVLNSLVAGQISYSYSYYAFICTSVTYEETPFGGTGSAQWTITEEYLLHDDGMGWDPAIYT